MLVALCLKSDINILSFVTNHLHLFKVHKLDAPFGFRQRPLVLVGFMPKLN